jgi:hypothetical protein
MPEVTVKYKSPKALKALQDLAKMFDLVIEKPVTQKSVSDEKVAENLPITVAKKPDIKALAGIWEGREITLEDLRKEAWGNRL